MRHLVSIYDIIQKEFKKIESPVIIEAGFFDCVDTAWLSGHTKTGRIYAFEPITSLFDKRNQGLKNVEYVNKALWNETGHKEIYLAQRDGQISCSSSLLDPGLGREFFPAITWEGMEVVETITLNEFISDKSINHIDLIWLDCEQAEHQILSACDRHYSKTDRIFVEVWNQEVYVGGKTKKDIIDLLREHFVVEANFQHDILFLNKRLK